MSQPILCAEGITKKFSRGKQDFYAVDGVSLILKSGTVTGLLGLNGAGKSTLSGIIASLTPPTAGKILYNNVDITQDLYAYRRAIGFVQQQVILEDSLNVREHLIFAGRLYGVPSNILDQRVDKLLAKFQLTEFSNSVPRTLSGGYRQRVVIARALVHNPQILLLDEPTSALDPHIRREIWQIILDLKKSGMAILLTTHNMDEAERLSDTICVLHNGRMLFVASPQELKNKFERADLEDVFVAIVESEKKSNNQ